MEENNTPTKFNMAIATLIRLDNLLKNCAHSSIIWDLIGWKDSLFTLRRNIFPFIQSDEVTHIEELFLKLNSKNWLTRSNKTNPSKYGALRVLPNQVDRVFNLLDEIEIYMQIAMKEAGILMPKPNDPRFALEQ